jgi:hypothetical protein
VRRPASLVLLVSLALAGCGSADQQKTPLICLKGPGPFVSQVRGGELPGHVPISSCLTNNQSAGDLAKVGSAMVTAATLMNAQVRRGPANLTPANLGFLVGAVARGASDTGGIHTNLLQRVTAAATYSPAGKSLSRYVKRLYRSGYAEGRAHG